MAQNFSITPKQQRFADEYQIDTNATAAAKRAGYSAKTAPMARVVGYRVDGVAPEVMGLGPVPAVSNLLRATGLALDAIDLVELNEAFAAQVLAVDRELRFDPERLNVNGGAIALGHPSGCSGMLSANCGHQLNPDP